MTLKHVIQIKSKLQDLLCEVSQLQQELHIQEIRSRHETRYKMIREFIIDFVLDSNHWPLQSTVRKALMHKMATTTGASSSNPNAHRVMFDREIQGLVADGRIVVNNKRLQLPEFDL